MDEAKLRLKLFKGARDYFKSCIEQGTSFDECKRRTENWLRNTIQAYGGKLTDNEVHNMIERIIGEIG